MRRPTCFHHVIIHGLWGGGLISAVLGTKLPGPGTIYLSQTLRFNHPVSIDDTITATLTVTHKQAEKGEVTLDCVCTNQGRQVVITGTAAVLAPRAKVRVKRITTPYVRVARHDGMQLLLARASAQTAVVTAVVHPVDAISLVAAVDAATAGFIVACVDWPSLPHQGRGGGRGRGYLRLPPGRSHRCRRRRGCPPVALARAGEVAMLMKGDLHTDVLMHPVMSSQTGLRTGKQISHVFVLDVPDYPRLLLLTDMAINIAPILAEKVGIVQNAIDCAHLIGIERPRVAILAPVEVVNPRLQATVDAAALCKMADRGQIIGGIVDGPLGFDNAISPVAAAEKGIVSDVAGRADILVVPDLDAGNMLAKEFTFLSGAAAAGVVMGATVPIILTSRADNAATRLASCAVGVLVARTK